MKFWKITFAALVIFVAGAVTGGVIAQLRKAEPPPSRQGSPGGPGPHRRDSGMSHLAERMQRDLDLSAEQRARIEEHLKSSHESMRGAWRDEFRRLNDQIKAELTPEQAARFEEMIKRRKSTKHFEIKKGTGERPGPERKPDC